MNNSQGSEQEELTLEQINKMDPSFRKAHKVLRKIENEMGQKSLYFVLKKHYQGKKGYTPKFEI